MASSVYAAPSSYKQVGKWQPYKGKADVKPKDPPPLGRSPIGGYTNPRFPSTWDRDVTPPAGGYSSIISTAAPFSATQRALLAKSPSLPQSYGQGSGSRSLSAMGGALSGLTSNAIQRSANEFETDFRRQAEKSRSEDILAQRQNQHDRYKMDVFKDIFDQDTDTRYTTGIKDLTQYWATEKWNENAKQTAMWLSFLGGML